MGTRWRAQSVRLKYTFIKAHRKSSIRRSCVVSSACRAADSMPGCINLSLIERWRISGCSASSARPMRRATGSMALLGSFSICEKQARPVARIGSPELCGQSPESPARLPSSLVWQRFHVTPDAHYAATRMYRPTAEHRLGHRYDVRAHLGRLALSGHRDGPVLPPHCWLGSQAHAGSRSRAGRAPHGCAQTQTPACPDSLRSRVSIRQ